MIGGIVDLDTGTIYADCSAEALPPTVVNFAVPYRTQDHQDAGIQWFHPRPDGQGECGGACGFVGRDMQGRWALVSDNPLTLTPSLDCKACGRHGFITDGRWKDC